MNKQPQLMDVARMRDILIPHLSQIREHVFLNSELAMVRGDHTVFSLLMRQKPPFAINDYRLGLIMSGEIDININLQDRHLTSGTLVYIGPGTIIYPKRLSADLRIFGMGLFSNFPMPFAQGQMPSAFNGQVRDFEIKVDESDIITARHFIDTIWHLVHQPDYNRQAVSSIVAAMMYHYDGLYRKHIDLLKASQSREQTIFDRFIYLVNQHATREHQIGFYADKMCLNEHYLGTVIRQASGITAKEWIDRALIEHIKIELKYSDKPIVQISEEMNFPNPSFFSKYFKRLTNQTPLEYKLSN